MPREQVTLHKYRHVLKHKLTGGYAHATCGVIGKPTTLAKAIVHCSACELSVRAEHPPNKDLAIAA